MTRRLLKWTAITLLALLAIPLLAVVAVAIAANIDIGRRFIEQQTTSLTGGIVRIQGLSGRFPDALRARRIEVADAKGPYVTIENLVLDWSPLQLVHRIAQIDLLQADQIQFIRLPESDNKTTTSDSTFELPVQVDLRRLQIARGNIGAPVAGAAAMLAITGSANLPTLTTGVIQLDASRLDREGHYTVNAQVTGDAIQAAIKADEPAKGLVSEIAQLPDLGAIAIQASVNGPRTALATQLGITAGPLTASATGTIDLTNEAADLAVTARAPAMTPAPDLSWQSILLDAKIHGPFLKPDANGTIRINGLAAAGARIGGLNADVTGNQGQVDLHATIQDLHIPGPKPDIFASDPLTLDASAHLDAADRPVTFTLRHPLVSADGTARTQGTEQLQAHLTLPNLEPLAATAGINLQGHTELDLTAERTGDTTTAIAKARLAITGGIAPAPALIGDDGLIDLAATLHGQDITLSHLTANGRALSLTAQGGLTDQHLDLDWTVALADLTAIQPSLSGSLDAKGHANGALQDLAVQAELGADLAAKGYKSGHLTANIDATGLPGAPHATVNAAGTLLDAPLTLAVTAQQDHGAISLNIAQAAWKSLQAAGDFTLTPPAIIPAGNLHLDIARLADFTPLLGRPLAGQAKIALESTDRAAKITATVRDAAIPGTAAIRKADLNATIDNPSGKNPDIDATLTADGIATAAANAMAARITAKGPLDAIALSVNADAPAIADSAAKLTTAGTIDLTGKTLALARLEASWKQQTLKLLSPAKFAFADGIAIDRLRLGIRQAELTVAGTAAETLNLTASLRDLPADLAAAVNPAFAATGAIAAEARLTGTPARPEGTVKLTATDMKQKQGPGQALPPANLTATATLLGTTARIDTRLTAGPSHVTLTGSVPLAQGGQLDLKTDGHVDLAMLDPLLMAQGRRARGIVNINAAIAGTTAAPLIRGTADLTKGDVADYTMGAHITNLNATVQAAGDTIRLASLSGKAGPGTIGGSGTISLAGAMPIDLRFTANDARPLSSDLMTASIDANLTLQGDVKGDLQAGGTLHVRRADIRIPDKMPPSIAVLPVRNANAPAPPPPETESPSRITLNLTLDAPQQVFIRGRGLDAELGGAIHVRGAAANPNPDGGLHLRRGTFTVVGTTLTFTEGAIDFSGAGIADPSIHFVATSTTATMVATLTIGGTAMDPKITLSSVPETPQDEILAQLLFNTTTSKLSPFQLAEIAAALAQMSGATSGFDPLESLRSTFGLDRLSVGSNSTGNPTLEAGRYLAKGVYLGAKQNATGNGTQATIQVDLAKGLKLETTAGSGNTSATGSTNSSDAASVGLTYQFEY